MSAVFTPSLVEPKDGAAALTRRRPLSRRWNAAMVVVPTLAIAVLGWRHRALTDDGTIFLRTVREILAGNGPNVNAGERVEANTSTLWQWLLVLLAWLTPGDLGFTAVVAGLVLTTAGVAVALDATRRLHTAAGPRPLVPAGVLVPLAVPVFWDFATAGLDTGLGTFWLAGCWWLLVRTYARPRARGQAWHAVWIGAGVLVRPDFALVTAVFLAGMWVLLRPTWRRALGYAAAGAAAPIAYEVFRAGYYGLLVPMPALTKEAGDSDPRRGFRYTWDFAEPVTLYVPAVLFGVVLAAWVFASRRDRRRLAVAATPFVAAVVLGAYVVRLGGDYMHGRMLLPVLFLAVLPAFLLPMTLPYAALAASTAVWAVAVLGPWNQAAYHGKGDDRTISMRVRDNDIRLTGSGNPDHTSAWRIAFPQLQAAIDAGLAAGRPVLIRESPDGTPPLLLPLRPGHGSATIAMPGGYLGVVGEMMPVDEYIMEYWGLANTVAAHLEYAPKAAKNWPGHRKPIDDVWILATELDPAVTHVPDGIPDVTDQGLAAARHALSCGDLKELLDSTRAPLTPSRFLRNLIGSYDRTKLRIPRDPFAAERRFCG
ncbi:hypothetical protein [Yinghuangia seranimata]|uniref:hypothetical protein n=1 Tax=Yinghuangia seranimata TaxID=408067 RepID=UPI00248CA7AB|nr:hypothetical protein [Yinghuangia seranimata]MDI2129581.1 hypothetical protein [Yinghuangia seranimata]